jgi:hypothetical protein
MFLVNWLASSTLFERVAGVVPPEPSTGVASFEKSLTREEDLNSDDRAKMIKIRRLWGHVANQLGVDGDQDVRFAFQHGMADTSVALWHEGNPTIVIPFSYLSEMVLDDDERAPDWDIWSKFIDNSPNQVTDMFSYAEGFKRQFSATKLKRLANRYGKYLSQLEFEAELAHEFGHIQAKHLNPVKGKRLTGILHSFASVVLPVAATAAASFFSFLLRDVSGGLDLALPLLGGLLSGLGFRAFFSQHVLRKSISYVRRQWEREADAIAAGSARLCEGNVRLYKKDILVRIVKGESIDFVSRRVFEDAEHHPSDGSRLRFFLGRLAKHTNSAVAKAADA